MVCLITLVWKGAKLKLARMPNNLVWKGAKLELARMSNNSGVEKGYISAS